MAISGPIPKPARLKILDGNPGKRDIPEEPDVTAGRPPKPAYADDVTSEAWDYAAELMAGMGLLSVQDGPLLAMYAETYSAYERVRCELDITGLIGKGAPQLHKYADRLIRLLAEMGLTPAGRARIGIGWQKATKDDPLDELIA